MEFNVDEFNKWKNFLEKVYEKAKNNGYQQGREDAIDEFAEKMIKDGWCMAQHCENDTCEECEASIRELAEQIKEQMNESR